MSQILAGFKLLVKNNILHRDLKPANIFMKDKSAKIADFGFARFYKPNVMMESFVGTPLYESP